MRAHLLLPTQEIKTVMAVIAVATAAFGADQRAVAAIGPAVRTTVEGALAPATPNVISGVVFEDRNGDGVRDADERGLPGVEVSNGREVVATDREGRYRIGAGESGAVFVVKPRGWRPRVDSLNLPRYYAAVPASPASRAAPAAPTALIDPPHEGATSATADGAFDFGLIPNAESDDLKVLVLTDPQPASPKEVGYLIHGLVDEIGGGADAAFGVTLGDLVYDRPDLFRPVSQALARLGVPWYNLPGNHDLALTPGDDRKAAAAFEEVYGPSTYAFHWGPALFVALDDVRPLGGPRMIGGLRPDQFAFIEALLGRARPEEWVVLMMHVPLALPDPGNPATFRAADRARLFALLQARPRVLVLSGHTHVQRHFFYGPPEGWTGSPALHEFNVAAACGGFWGGPPDGRGIPVATMPDGTPPGYGRLTFHAGAVACDYRPERFPADHQIGLHLPKALAAGAGYVSFYANVFNGHGGWTVEARVDDRQWQPMGLKPGWDPAFAAAFLAQDETGHPAAGPRLPDPGICYHLWRAYFPADLNTGTHRLEVRASDPAGGGGYVSADTFQVVPP